MVGPPFRCTCIPCFLGEVMSRHRVQPDPKKVHKVKTLHDRIKNIIKKYEAMVFCNGKEQLYLETHVSSVKREIS